jgi:hypothetical protein
MSIFLAPGTVLAYIEEEITNENSNHSTAITSKPQSANGAIF